MSHRPVCVKCQLEMLPKKNGVGCEDMVEDKAVALWSSDEWECPRCHIQILASFGVRALAELYDPNYKQMREWREVDGIVQVWENLEDREAFCGKVSGTCPQVREDKVGQ